MMLTRRAVCCVVVVGFVASLGCSARAESPPREARALVSLSAEYPGASARTVVDAIAAPVEMQLQGGDVSRLYSRSSKDGKYRLFVTFKASVKPGEALTLAQNRATLAMPGLPFAVSNEGVSLRKVGGGVALFVVLYSPDASCDVLYLSNYASSQLTPALSRLPAVLNAVPMGTPDYRLEVQLDPTRLAAFNLTASDVIDTLKARTAPGAANGPGDGAGPVADLVLKMDKEGRTVRLKDVAKLESTVDSLQHFTRLNGKPAVAMAISPLPGADARELRSEVWKEMGRIHAYFPKGIDYNISIDLSEAHLYGKTPSGITDFLLTELSFPSSMSPQKRLEVVERCEQIVLRTPGVDHCLSLSENPFTRFGGGPCVLASLRGKVDRETLEGLLPKLRSKMSKEIENRDVELRFRYLPRAGTTPAGYPVDFCIRGPDDKEVREAGKRVLQQLKRNGKLTDVGSESELSGTDHFRVEFDRDRSTALGVHSDNVLKSVELLLGSTRVGDFHEFDRPWPIRVQLGKGEIGLEDAFKQVKVRNSQGDSVPLSTLAKLTKTSGPTYYDRLDLEPAFEITANPAKGVSLGQVRRICEAAGARELPRNYQLVWMRALPEAEPAASDEKKEASTSEPAIVSVARPIVREIADSVDLTGRFEASQCVDIRARVSGYLVKCAFREGDKVKKGELLFEIDPRPYQIAVDQAESQLQVQEASLKLARSTLARREAAAKSTPGAVSQAEMDEAAAASAEAEARLRAAKASYQSAKLNLEYTRVTSPIDGRIGRQYFTIGNLVTSDATQLATVLNSDPMYVYFDLDERTFLELRRANRKLAVPAEFRPILVGLVDEKGYSRTAKVDFLDNRIDPKTGTVQVRGVLSNADGLLMPGMFVRIRMQLGEPYRALFVPEEAIGSDQGVKFVYVVDDQNNVGYRPVKLGVQQDGQRAVLDGLKVQDRVIVGGLKFLRPGEKVNPKESNAPEEKKASSAGKK